MDTRLAGRDFLTLLDYTPEEISYLIDLASTLKYFKHNRVSHRYFEDKNIALIFEKTSTRTRSAFEVAAHDLGMGSTYIGPGASQLGKKESVEDTAKVLSRMYDAIMYRGFGQEIVQTLADASDVPVYNALTTEFHPTQMLADMLTVREHFGTLGGLTLTFMGDAQNNVANSLMVVCSKLGINFRACGPAAQMPSADLVERCRQIAEETGSDILLTEDVAEGVRGSDVVYTDIWVSMGEPAELWEERIALLSPYQVNADVMAQANDGAIFMHCLPSFHDRNTVVGQEIYERFGISEMECTDEVFRSEASVVFDEAENRLHSIKAVILATLAYADDDES